MKKPLLVGYIISALFIVVALVGWNFEFLIYAGAVVVLVGVLHKLDGNYDFNTWALWGFNAWVLMHIAGGFLNVAGDALYNLVLIPIIGEPYHVLKYDQFVHVYCYFIFALLMWSVVSKISTKKASFGIVAFITVMAASGIGGINEIIEFVTTWFFDNNVGGYVNTAIDICANMVGALLAIPFFKKL